MNHSSADSFHLRQSVHLSPLGSTSLTFFSSSSSQLIVASRYSICLLWCQKVCVWLLSGIWFSSEQEPTIRSRLTVLFSVSLFSTQRYLTQLITHNDAHVFLFLATFFSSSSLAPMIYLVLGSPPLEAVDRRRHTLVILGKRITTFNMRNITKKFNFQEQRNK